MLILSTNSTILMCVESGMISTLPFLNTGHVAERYWRIVFFNRSEEVEEEGGEEEEEEAVVVAVLVVVVGR